MAKRYLSEVGWIVPDETHYFMCADGTWKRMDLTLDENPFSVKFATDLTGIKYASGNWNKSKARLEC